MNSNKVRTRFIAPLGPWVKKRTELIFLETSRKVYLSQISFDEFVIPEKIENRGGDSLSLQRFSNTIQSLLKVS